MWKSRCKTTDEIVAVKVLDLEEHEPEHLDEIRREAQTMSMLSHPNLVKYYCSFVHESSLWVVMPFLAGGSTLNLMKWSHPSGFEEPVIACIVKAALKALDYFHRNGNIHRDIKAGNILVDADGAVKLADFGVSASCWGSGGRPRTRLTFVGTPCWMAPEVMEQESGYDFHADIWSLGITVLELCHGHAPFSKYPPMKVLLMTLQNPAPTLEEKQADGRHFSRALREFVTLCLQKDPSKRPSASKLLEHKFLKEAKKADWLAKTLLDNIPSLGERTRMLAEREARRRKESNAEGEEQAEAASNEAYKHGVSNWNFDVEELKAQAASMDDPTVAESDALAAANALDNLNLGSDKKGVEKKGRFEIITESSTPDQPQEQSQTSQPVQRRGRFDIIEESKGASRSVSRVARVRPRCLVRRVYPRARYKRVASQCTRTAILPRWASTFVTFPKPCSRRLRYTTCFAISTNRRAHRNPLSRNYRMKTRDSAPRLQNSNVRRRARANVSLSHRYCFTPRNH